MSKEIRLNAFSLAAPSHLSMGLWRHPRDRSLEYNQLSYWTDLAQIAEKGKFDALFLADGISLYDVYRGSADTAIRHGVQFPRLDPLLLVSAMAHVTTHLGFGITSSVSYESPYMFARRMSTLDHITGGRAGWNIVTSFGDSGTKALNGQAARAHDDRYDVADEYMSLVYQYWEGSWEDGAVLRDREQGVFADPARIHKVEHEGEFFRSEGIHICEPSPQRTPLLFQAGTSERGKTFAARHAECVFISAPSKKVVKNAVDDIRQRAVQAGRPADSIKVFLSLTAIPAETDEQAQAKYQDYLQYTSAEGAAALFSRWTGIDLAKYGLDDPIQYVDSNHMQSAINNYTRADPDKVWTFREILARVAIGGGSANLLVGSPTTIADQMQEWVDDTGIDGFNLGYAVAHESFQDFVDLVVPELQRRGVYKQDYAPGTLREKIYGSGQARLPDDHPAARARRA
ncbi:NtaA/DmoA family FMN-dependent monooxygenase [Paraburkholderia sp. CNPSo 3155]|uniref:LLM class flavin-dependent oxidoreductase n=1 Tax=Paraburkholderia atlantica TaxID=2654982 RepID=UPI00128E1F55|nr:LLM class flavin-dependent oxidoreductase [Paraburkholderia atlantica]MPW09016.1 NtaA/DmoA family FMN-dependent monooxygenase [Paraburkholderia atlantica]